MQAVGVQPAYVSYLTSVDKTRSPIGFLKIRHVRSRTTTMLWLY